MTTVVLAHGAWGAPSDWDDVVAAAGLVDTHRLDLVDISASTETIEVNEVWKVAIDTIASGLPSGPLLLAGYSLGARLMLGLALHPAVRSRLAGLLLVAGTAGVDAPAARAARAVVDDERAAWQARDPATFLAAFWDLPLFAGLREHPRRAELLAERTARAQLAPARLAHLMRGLSVGRMPSLWSALPSLSVPVVVVNGALDRDYVLVGERLLSVLPRARQVIVEGASHALLLEAPSTMGATLRDLVGECT
jgi:2-succinyl-6-hydroxy-2,4-cyclohexadiene-1-carboxylate synthase